MTSRRYAAAKAKVQAKYAFAYAMKNFIYKKPGYTWTIGVCFFSNRVRTLASGKTRAEAWRNAAKGLK
jgi:hypothetical protein